LPPPRSEPGTGALALDAYNQLNEKYSLAFPTKAVARSAHLFPVYTVDTQSLTRQYTARARQTASESWDYQLLISQQLVMRVSEQEIAKERVLPKR
jgi:hypothetical protein